MTKRGKKGRARQSHVLKQRPAANSTPHADSPTFGVHTQARVPPAKPTKAGPLGTYVRTEHTDVWLPCEHENAWWMVGLNKQHITPVIAKLMHGLAI